ncbi:hypothetical protein GY45DRAFT_1430212 [Cubamyces sp. BRFM 1775]|nr:hypothetical protein GY45DRAFT_1430212 [Cubamyces sp. BRFM 1775]
MLKRQRSSPSFVPESPYAATPEPAIDVFERVAKRRRQFAPPLDRTSHNSWAMDDTDGEEDVEGEESSAGRQATSDPERGQRMNQAGEYRNVNSLLHDLHAEQRHRMLFSSSLSQSHLSMLHHTEPPYVAASADKTLPALSSNNLPTAPPPHEIRKAPSSFTISIPSKDAAMVDHVEVQRVIERYEDTNRYLGSVFLNRRRQFDTTSQQNEG